MPIDRDTKPTPGLPGTKSGLTAVTWSDANSKPAQDDFQYPMGIASLTNVT